MAAIEPKPIVASGMNHSTRWGCMAKVSSGSSALICLRVSSVVGVELMCGSSGPAGGSLVG